MDILHDVSRRKIILLVFLIILLQLILSTYFMATQKNGYYSDDMYSYGFANSPGTFNPLEVNGKVNTNHWMSGDVLREYLTVSPGERFTFDRITSTLKRDAHPPLYYFLLHIICSFFPNIFSKWFGYAINVFAFILLQVYFYRLNLFISRNRFISILTMTVFGFSSASINMMSLLRMYLLATAFTVAFTFYVMRYTFNTTEKIIKNKSLLMSCIFLYLGSMTVYLSVIFAFLLTLFMCGFLLFGKHFKKMFVLGFSLLLSVALMVLSFPTFIDQIKSDQVAMQGAELYPFMLQVRTCINIIFNGLFAINTPIFPSMLSFYVTTGLIAIIFLYLLVFFIFRHDSWFLEFNKKALSWIKNTFKKSLPYTKTILPLFICCVIMILYFSRTLQIYFYKSLAMRYLYILTPFILLIILIPIFKLLRSKYFILILSMLVCCVSVKFGNKCYLEKELHTRELSEITSGSDVIVVSSQSAMFMHHIADLINCRNFLYTNLKSVAEERPGKPAVEMSKKSDRMFLMVDLDATSTSPQRTRMLDGTDGHQYQTSDEDNDILHYFRSLPGFDNINYNGEYYDCFLYILK